MSRTLRFHQFGGPDVLQYDDIETGDPGAGEIRIRVETIGLNRSECLFRSGAHATRPRLPSLIGGEGVGIVEAIGDGVRNILPGDRVCVVPSFSQGMYGICGDTAIVPVSAVLPASEELSSIEAASIWVAYCTAYALIEMANMRSGDFVVITAASSSVGIAAIQLAGLVGATPIAITRHRSKMAALGKMGAAHIIATDSMDVVAEVMRITGGEGARIAFDSVAGPDLEMLARAMAEEGMILIYGDLSRQPTPYPLQTAMIKGLRIGGFVAPNLIWKRPERFARARGVIEAGLKAGKLFPVIARIFPFEEIADAYRYLESNEQIGKIVVAT